MLDELEWPSLVDRRVKSSLTFFYKIHSGTVSLDKDRYLTPAPNFRSTRASHEAHIHKIYGLLHFYQFSVLAQKCDVGLVLLHMFMKTSYPHRSHKDRHWS